MPLLFCYGSNHPKQLKDRLGHPTVNVGAVAHDVQRVFRGHSRGWKGAVASLEKKAGAATYGYVAKVSATDLEVLDAYEGVAGGAYVRTSVSVETEHGKERAVAYVATSRVKGTPSKAYLAAVVTTIGSFWAGDDGPVRASDIPIR